MKTPTSHRLFLLLTVALVVAACGDDAASDNPGATSNGATGATSMDAGGDAAATDTGASTDGGEDVSPDTPDGEADAAEAEGAVVLMDPTSDDFFANPLPSDMRTDAMGRPQLREWPGGEENVVLGSWFDAAELFLDGWGLITTQHVWFSESIDPASLPDPESPEATTDLSGAPPAVLMIDVDPNSPDVGAPSPLKCKYIDPEGTFHAAHMLSCRPPLGVVRRPGTRYAFVVTRSLLDASGAPVRRSEAMEALMGGESVENRFGRTIDGADYTQAMEVITGAGVDAEQVVSVTLFTTHDPAARLKRLARWYDDQPVPELPEDGQLEVVQTYDDYVVLRGSYDLPVIQRGERPYAMPPAGQIVFGEDGEPEVQGHQRVRFFVTLPINTPMPSGGFPVLGFMHGTGGRAEQLMDRGAQPDRGTPPTRGTGPASVIAPYGIAGFSSDFPLHGERLDTPSAALVNDLYNITDNAAASIDGFLIGACELTLHTRLLQTLTIDPDVAPGLLDPGTAEDGLIRFNTDRFTWMGQSMGANIALLTATVEKLSPAIILSGSGNGLVEIAVASDLALAPLLEPLLAYREDEVLDQYDPVLNFVQLTWELVDTFPHARHLAQEPHEGVPPKHILLHSGLTDVYFSPTSRAALGAALGAELVEPVHEPFAFGIQTLLGGPEAAVPLPVSGNGPAGRTLVVAQYEPDGVLSGHDVAYQRDDTKAQYACFARSVSPGAATFRAVEASEVDACLGD